MAIRNTLGGPDTQFLIFWGRKKAPAAATEGRKKLGFSRSVFSGGKKRLRQLRRVEKSSELHQIPLDRAPEGRKTPKTIIFFFVCWAAESGPDEELLLKNSCYLTALISLRIICCNVGC